MRTGKKVWRSTGLALCAFAGTAFAAGPGPLKAPLLSFTDTKPSRIVWIVPGVIKRENMSTDFLCTNLDAVAADIGVEGFDFDGTQLNKIDNSMPISGSTCQTGAIVGVDPGHTVTIGLAGTAELHEDCKIGLGAVAQGSARIVSTSHRIRCDAVALDQKHLVVDPATCSPTGSGSTLCQPPPSMTSLKVIKAK